MKNGNIKGAGALWVAVMTLIQGRFMHLTFIQCLNGRFHERSKHEPSVEVMPVIPAPGRDHKKEAKKKKRIRERHLASRGD